MDRIMENIVHVHPFLSFVLILWANREEKKYIPVSCGTISYSNACDSQS